VTIKVNRESAEKLGRFLLVGGTAAIVALGMRAIFYLILNYEISVGLGHFCGMIVAFFLNLHFVFHDYKGPLGAAFMRFTVVNLLSLAIAVVISSLAFRWFLPLLGDVPLPALTAHIIGAGCAALPSFIFHSTFSFKVR
jgi:putative flippase GtrA